jgi:hypothetical protein
MKVFALGLFAKPLTDEQRKRILPKEVPDTLPTLREYGSGRMRKPSAIETAQEQEDEQRQQAQDLAEEQGYIPEPPEGYMTDPEDEDDDDGDTDSNDEDDDDGDEE